MPKKPVGLMAIDIGNTNTVVGVYKGKKLAHFWRLASAPHRTLDEIEIILRGLFQVKGVAQDDINGVIISSVVPALTPVFDSVSRAFPGKTPLIVGPGIKTGISIRYDDPREVGADRIVNAVAAFKRFGGPVIVVDFGTATTFDYISAEGAYMGGLIAPGIAVSMEALFSRTSKLPKVALERPPKVVCKNTVHAMQAGIYYGYASLVDGLISRIIAETGQKAKVVATGGAAKLIAKESKLIEEVDEILTLEGLRILYELNQES